MANNFNQSKRGVVILFAVLLVSVILTISLGVFNITYRQLVLSSLAKESEVAFAVADSARNCAVYWNSLERGTGEHPFGYYGLDDSDNLILKPKDSNAVNCASDSPNYPSGGWKVSDNGSGTFIFYMKPNISGRDVCAKVIVEKTNPNDPDAEQKTTITADGYNLAKEGAGQGDDCTPTSLNRAVNRRIQTVI